MDLFSLILYTTINLSMLIRYVAGPRGRIYELPFWMGIMAVGWFLPQAIGGYLNFHRYPQGGYASALYFASLCSLALWVGYEMAVKKKINTGNWLCWRLQQQKLYLASICLCFFGFYFFFKLSSLATDQITTTEYGQWTGVPVRYLFFSNAYKIGFIALLLMYWGQRRLMNKRFLIFLIPCFAVMLTPIFLGGRRADMMVLVAYLFLPIWFKRRWVFPRSILIVCLAAGLIFINSIEIYRGTMEKFKNLDLSARIHTALEQDYLSSNFRILKESGPEFEKYVYRMNAVNRLGFFDYGLSHWNMFVFNYVPAQIVGRELKTKLLKDIVTPHQAGLSVHHFEGQPGATDTGYLDAFASFSWLGFLKFYLIGAMMGLIYRYAREGFFLPQLLYPFLLTAGMHAITHDTNEVLVRAWVYFLIFGFPLYFWARAHRLRTFDFIRRQTMCQINRSEG